MRAVEAATLTVGEVQIPVKVYLAASPTARHIHWINGYKHRVVMRFFDAITGREVKRQHIRRGVEVEKGKYSPLTAAEMTSLAGDKRSIIQTGAVAPNIDLHRIQKSYFLAPDKSDKAYRLLQILLGQIHHFIIGKWYDRRGRDRCIAIQSVDGVLVMSVVYFPAECRAMNIAYPPGSECSPQEVRLAELLLRTLRVPAVDWGQYRSEWNDRLQRVLQVKIDAQTGMERLLVRSIRKSNRSHKP